MGRIVMVDPGVETCKRTGRRARFVHLYPDTNTPAMRLAVKHNCNVIVRVKIKRAPYE